MPTYINTEPFAVTVQLFDAITEIGGDGLPMVRAVPLPPVTIMPGETAVLPQVVDGNVLNLIPDVPPPTILP